MRPATGTAAVQTPLGAGTSFLGCFKAPIRAPMRPSRRPVSHVRIAAVLEQAPKDLSSSNGAVQAANDVNSIKRDILLQAKEKDPKFVYYLSAEFLMGRTLINALHNMEIDETYKGALKELGYELEDIYDQEKDAALGNGGLGRLAACFLDSMSTLDLPGWGYGIRYHYGLFRQIIQDGVQREAPDYWLDTIGVGTPWEIPRPDIRYKIAFFGRMNGSKWEPGEEVWAQAYDTPIPGYATKTCGNLRLWEAVPVDAFNLGAFNDGDYVRADEARRRASMITAVLYPNDATDEGRLLRLKQQYFFTSASLQDAIVRFKAQHGTNWDIMPQKFIVQMNDTHPTSAVAELMRLLIDQEGLTWEKAWALTKETLAFTNHTVMPEALEKWNVKVYGQLLPRNMQIIERINEEWLAEMKPYVTRKLKEGGTLKPIEVEVTDPKTGKTVVEKKTPSVEEAIENTLATQFAIIQPNKWQPENIEVNMAYLAIVGSKFVNGVAAIHTEILKQDLFKQFYELWPEKFQNKTNGVTPRRWLAQCNEPLRKLITETLGTPEWEKDLDKLRGLLAYADDKDFQAKWAEAKYQNKLRLAKYIKQWTGEDIPPHFLFDVMIKRIHEYKRQHMNVFSVIHKYLELKKMSPEERAKQVPRAVIFGGKAASAYFMAKEIIKLAVAVQHKINNDPDVNNVLRLVYVPDYNVSKAEIMIPGAELSQHISTAGTEASGTSNMKFAMNGSLIIGTLDGANIEIAECAGQEKLFIFGMLADEVPAWREGKRKTWKGQAPEWKAVMQAIRSGMFGGGFDDVVDNVDDMEKSNDWFLVAPDFKGYLEQQKRVEELYQDQATWTKYSIFMAATSGKFNSDRTIQQYADEIWDVKPTRVPSN